VELLHHASPHLKDELQLLRIGDTGWTMVAFCVWVEQLGTDWAVNRGDFLLDDASVSFHGFICIHCCNADVGAILDTRDHVEEGFWWNLNWFL
jgi:hypothetical protein